TRQDAGGLVFRRLIIPAILISLLLGWLRVTGQNLGFYDTEFGTAVRTLAEILMLLGLLWFASSSISKLEAQTRLSSLMPAENPHPVLRMSAEGWVLYANPAAARLAVDWNQTSDDPIAAQFREGVAQAFADLTKLEQQVEIGGST